MFRAKGLNANEIYFRITSIRVRVIVGFSDYTLYMSLSKLGMTVIPELSEARPSEWLLSNLNRSRFRQFHDGPNLEHDIETIDGLSDHAREK